MYFKWLPTVAVNQMEEALNNNDGIRISELYQKYLYNSSIDTVHSAVWECVDHFEKNTIKVFNNKFCNYQNEEAMKSFLRNMYGNLFLNKDDTYSNQEVFDDLYSVLESKIEFCDFYFNVYQPYLMYLDTKSNEPDDNEMEPKERAHKEIADTFTSIEFRTTVVEVKSNMTDRDVYYNEIIKIEEEFLYR